MTMETILWFMGAWL